MTSSDRDAGVRVVDAAEESMDAPGVFELLSDETRVGIVRELAAGEDLRFSTLRERVGTADSGKFNYHLERLRGNLVRKTEEGYRLTRAGRKLVDVVEASELQ